MSCRFLALASLVLLLLLTACGSGSSGSGSVPGADTLDATAPVDALAPTDATTDTPNLPDTFRADVPGDAGEGRDVPPRKDSDQPLDVADDVALPPDVSLPPDSVVRDTFGPDEGTPDAGGEDAGLPPPADVEGPDSGTPGGDGLFGEECGSDADCASGVCADTAFGGLCSRLCTSNCPYGWACEMAEDEDGVLMAICLPLVESDLCVPCASDADCGGERDHCLSVGDGGTACGRYCSDARPCPGGFSCDQVASVDGVVGRQCVPVTGSCVCSEELAGLERPCEKANEFGTCSGHETCEGATGWSACNAPTPSSEVCDGEDNDCNGEEDDGLPAPPCTAQNEFGVCDGVRRCAGAAGWECDAPSPAAEECDGLDNDCDGATDERLADVACENENAYGACPGIAVCQGEDGWVCDAPTPMLDDCDGLDNDCDGETDGGLTTEPCALANEFGVCAGTATCNGAEGWTCDAPAPAEEACDGLDNDCDREVDEDLVGAACEIANDVGTCHGNERCLGGTGWACDAATPADELCDGVDNDCDGETDEDFALEPCEATSEYGTCGGTFRCASDGSRFCDAPTPVPEQCDGRDDDCDGDTDEGLLERDCLTANEFGACRGMERCAGEDGWSCDAPTPSAEACDGADNDCDGATDERLDTRACENTNEFGTCRGTATCTGEGGWDCDAATPVAELCDLLDNNCDGRTDEGLPDADRNGVPDCRDTDDDGDGLEDESDNCQTDFNPGQEDLDGDGKGDACDADDDGDTVPDGIDNCPRVANALQPDRDRDRIGDACDDDVDGDGVPNRLDCAPEEGRVFQGATEACEGLDNNCNGATDEGFPDTDGDRQMDCVDADDDNDGDPDTTDCADLDASVHAGVEEVCNGRDDDCDGVRDNGFTDADRDGEADCADADDDADGDPDQNDCRPLDAAVSHGADELCNGADDNCNGVTDEGFSDADADGRKDCVDTDDDGDGDPDATDCAPLDPSRETGATEICNGLDDDCEGGIDEGFADVDANGVKDCLETDADADGDPDPSDCADADPNVFHGQVEACDGDDDNCSGVSDEGFPDTDDDGQKDCVDTDDDGDGVADATDCAPNDRSIHQGASELCDGVDQDCDAEIDEGFEDVDGDGDPDCTESDLDGDGDRDAFDCAPADEAVFHGATETCNGIDDNCTGVTDEGFPDTDGDRQKDCADTDDDGDGAADGADCKPLDRAIFPGAVEVCDGVDNDCTAGADNGFPDTDRDGTADCTDGDDDGDTIADERDNCPVVANLDQLDTNRDGEGNLCDVDDDGDGIPDTDDNCPLVPNPGQLDEDADLLGDVCDPTPHGPLPVCGNGVVEEDELCDEGLDNSNTDPDACRLNCVPASCGDATRDSGEHCDDGPLNSNAVADACRTNCTSARCGDRVVDSGEQCDDGNTLETDGCNRLCRTVPIVGIVLPYTQSFDDATTFGYVAWGATSDEGSAANDWILATGGSLGPDIHPRFQFVPEVTDFMDRIVSPTLNASAAAKVTLTFDVFFLPAVNSPELVASVLVTTDNGQTWRSAWRRTGAEGSYGPTTIEVDLTHLMANQPLARVAFQIAGPDSGELTFFEIDSVRVGAGAPPVLADVADMTVTAGESRDVTVTATDPDTAPASLDFSLSGAPSFVSLEEPGNGTAILHVRPSAATTGIFQGVTVRVTDGTYAASDRFTITVVPPSQETQVRRIILRDAPGGGGAPVGPLALDVGDSVRLYAAGYDASLNYLGETPVLWESTGTLDEVPIGPTSSLTFTPTTGDTSGQIVASHLNPLITGDSTGLIEVSFPPPGQVDPAQSTLTSSKGSLLADGVETAILTLSLFDTQGQPITDHRTVVFATTHGTLVGAVVDGGNGKYTQTLRSVVTPGTATVTATVDGTLINARVVVQVVQLQDLIAQGVATINCANYATFRNQNIVVRNGTLTIDSGPECAPMQFGSVYVGQSGIITHPQTTATTEKKLDIWVQNLTIEAGGCIDVSGQGYKGGYTRGNTTVGGALASGGGSNGGFGGQPSGGRAPSTYGDLAAPSYPGAGGGAYSSYTGADGGGVVRVKVLDQGHLVVNGCIKANGTNGQNEGTYGGGGAGGSIFLQASHVSGTGTVQATGGTAHPSYSAAGGGGRVAVVGFDQLADGFEWTTIFDRFDLRGGAQGSVLGGAGTLYLKPAGETYGRLVVDNEGQNAPVGSTPLPTVAEGEVDRITNGNKIEDFDSNFLPGAFVGYRVNPALGQGNDPTLEDDQHFLIADNDSNSISVAGTLTGIATAGGAYRGIHVFDRVQVRGGAHLATVGDLLVLGGDMGARADTFEVDGGLAARTLDLVDVTKLDVLDGTFDVEELVADGAGDYDFEITLSAATFRKPVTTAANITMTAGSVLRTETLDVAGNLAATGGELRVEPFAVGRTSATMGAATVAGTLTLTAVTTGVAGDLHVVGTTRLDDTTFTLDTLDADADVFVVGTSRLTVMDELVDVTGNLRIGDGIETATLTHGDPTDTNLRGLDLRVGGLTLMDLSTIDVTARGYASGKSWSSLATFLPTYRAGGSHGGLGGTPGPSDSVPGAAYGRYDAPYTLGGGGVSPWSYAGRGGGRVRILATNYVAVNGTISANGEAGGRSGGAGGSIHISSPYVSGSGTATAIGGDGHNSYACGGGGGRIAITGYTSATGHFAPSGAAGFLRVRGAPGCGGYYGGSGTVYLKGAAQTYGDLLVDNENVPNGNTTPLVTIAAGNVDVLAARTVTDYDCAFVAGHLVGARLNPHFPQGNAGLADDQTVLVTANDNCSLTVAEGTDLRTLTATGAAFRHLFVFDRLLVRGGARLTTDGDILVRDGDLTVDGNFRMDGSVAAARLDLDRQTSVTLANGGVLDVDELIGDANAAYAFTFTLDNATLDEPHVRSAGMTLTNGTVRGSDMTVTGDVTMTTSSVNLDTGALGVSGRLTADGGTLTFGTASIGGNLTLSGAATATVLADDLTVGGHFQMSGSAVLTHGDTTPTKVYRLNVVARSMAIAAGTKIDVTGRGYKGSSSTTLAYAIGNVTDRGAGNSTGGSHGGLGQLSPWNTTVAPVYDSLYRPTLPGGGGGRHADHPGYPGGDGGGVVRLAVASSLVLHGDILANGEQTVNYGGGGAGGAILIETPSFGGAGRMFAQGGPGTPSHGGAGGGGRIAIRDYTTIGGNFALSVIMNNVAMASNTGYGGTGGGAGTLFLKSATDAWGSLITDNRNVVSAAGSTPLLVVPPGIVDAISGAVLTDYDANLRANDWAGYFVIPDVDKGTGGIGENDILTVTGNSLSTLTLDEPLTGFTAVGKRYRGVHVFDNLQIQGKADVDVAGDLWVTGGDLFSDDASTFTLAGGLKAVRLDLQDATAVTVGNVRLDVQQLIRGGSPTAGFDFTLNDSILVMPTTHATSMVGTNGSMTVGTLQVDTDLTLTGGTGTVDTATVGGNAHFTSYTSTIGKLTVGGNFDLDGTSTMTVTNRDLTVTGTARLGGTATLTHGDTTTAKVYELLVTAQHLVIDPTAKIDVSGRGYKGATSTATAYTRGNATTNGARDNVGGAHGGMGGASAYGEPASPVYDSIWAPRFPGGGGGRHQGSASYPGGDGGGYVHVVTSGSVAVNGAIRADGDTTPATYSGGGAGGGVLIEALSVSGTGQVTARGGDVPASWAGGGGGGRIAVVGYTQATGIFAPATTAGRILAHGGNGWSTAAGAGTYFTRGRNETYGRLIIDNGDRTPLADSTPLDRVGVGTIDTVTARVLHDYGAGWVDGDLVDYRVNPKTGQGDATLSDDASFVITANTAQSFTVGAADDMAAVAARGDEYADFFVFDDLDIRGRAKVSTSGDILVLSGDIASNDATTFSLRGALEARTLDLMGVTKIVVNNGGLQVTNLIGDGELDFPFEWDVDGSALALGNFAASDLAIDASTLTGGTVTVTGNLAITGGSGTVQRIEGTGAARLSGGTYTVGTLAIDGNTQITSTSLTTDTIEVGGNLTIDGTSTVTVMNKDVIALGSMFVLDTSTLTHGDTTTARVYTLEITANDLLVGTGAKIDVSGRGYKGGASVPGYTWGNVSTNGAGDMCGGSNGGIGGIGSGCPGAAIAFGDFREPKLPGGGGGRYSSASYPGGDGGGVVRIQVTEAVAVNGAVRADGDSTTSYGAGGAGGSVLILCDSLGGSGAITARGGNGHPSYGGGGGGGGRLAAVGFNTLTDRFALTIGAPGFDARGGSGWNSQNGGAGTVFLRSNTQTHGDLIVDNFSVVSAAGSTPILAIPQGIIDVIDATGATVTDLDAEWKPDLYAGLLVNPNVAQGTERLTDDVLFTIESNLLNRFTCVLPAGEDLYDVTAPGYVFRGIAVLDNLELRGAAHVKSVGDLLVYGGDLHTGDAKTLELRGAATLEINWLDMEDASRSDLKGGTVTITRVFCDSGC